MTSVFSYRNALKNKLYVAGVGGILAIALKGLILSNGVVLNPDGWAYWEGSVSLLNGNGYSYFGGQNITVFPPLFSFLLSIVQSIIGVSGLSIVIYLMIISGITAFIWIYLFLSISNEKHMSVICALTMCLYVVAFITSYFTSLLADTLSLFLIGVSLLVISKLSNESGNKSSIHGLLIFLILALLLTKNSNIALLPGFMCVIIVLTRAGWIKRIFTGVLVVIIPFFIWFFTRYFLGQTASHPVTFSGKYSLTEYLGQFASGMSIFLGPSIVGVTLLIASLVLITSRLSLLCNTSLYKEVFFNLHVVVLGGIGSLFILFNLTWVHDEFSGRFLWGIPLVIVGTLCIVSSMESSTLMRRIIVIILILVTSVQVARMAKKIFNLQAPAIEKTVLLNYTIDPDYYFGPKVGRGDYTLISPPAFRWVNRSGEVKSLPE